MIEVWSGWKSIIKLFVCKVNVQIGARDVYVCRRVVKKELKNC